MLLVISEYIILRFANSHVNFICRFSRCGIIKDPLLLSNGTSMSVWYRDTPSKKAFNNCPAPRAFIAKIDVARSIVSINTAGE